MSQSSRVWLITGTSTGFGRYMTEHLLSLGGSVVATLRSPSALDDLKEKHSSSKLLVVKCDVTKPGDIAFAFERAKQTFGYIDVVFNNAGYGIVGEVEGIPDDVARKMFEVNFWGAVNVSKEAVRFFREDNPKGSGGVLLVNSSVLGTDASPCIGVYSASKAALDGITEALAKELDPLWNIQITIVKPGWFETSMRSKASILPTHSAYTRPSSATQLVRRSIHDLDTKLPGDPKKAVARIVEFVDAGRKKDADLPFYWMIGKDCIAQVRNKFASLMSNVDRSEGWSENLMLENP